jgi:hypothetical protein
MLSVLSGPEIIKLGIQLSVGVTATQAGLTKVQLEAFDYFLSVFPVKVIRHGDCVGGDDQLANRARKRKIYLISHPSNLVAKRAYAESDEYLDMKPPLDRNRDIVDHSFMLWGFPKGPEELRSGTWATIRYAWKERKPTMVIYPEGTIEGFFGY